MPKKRLRNHVALGLAVLAALAVATLGAVSMVRAVETFQPAGFAARATGGGWTVVRGLRPETGLRPGDQILLVGGELVDRPRRAAAPEPRPTSWWCSGDGELVDVPYRRPPLEVDWPYLILAFTAASTC